MHTTLADRAATRPVGVPSTAQLMALTPLGSCCSGSYASSSSSSSSSSTASGSTVVRFDEKCDVADESMCSSWGEASDAAPCHLAVGMRVTTLCALNVTNGRGICRPGPGRIFGVYDDGVYMVAMDTVDVTTVLVLAEDGDLQLDCVALPRGTHVRARGLVVNTPAGCAEIPAETMGEVLQHNVDANTYDVAFWSLKAKVAVPAPVLHVVAYPDAPRRPLIQRVAKHVARAAARLRANTRSGAGGADDAASAAARELLRKQPMRSNIRKPVRGH